MNQPAQLIEVIPAMTPESLEQVRHREEAARQERLARLKEDMEQADGQAQEQGETESPEHREKRLREEARRTAFLNEAEGALNRFDGIDCPVCRNRGYFYTMTEEGDVLARACGCKTKRAVLRRIRESGLQSLIRQCTFDSYEVKDDWQRTMKETAMAFCNDPDAAWFYAGGQVGCGKTHICTAICEYYIRKGRDVRYLMWAETAKHLKAMVNDYAAYTKLINEYKRIDVLYIDDFLKVRQGTDPSDGDLNLAFELINARLLRPGGVTVISSEKTLQEAMDYDEATFSRIFKQCGRYYVAVGREQGRNYRLRG